MMVTECMGYLLDENEGEFIAEDGKKIPFHNARFYDPERGQLFKATISKDSHDLPQPMQEVRLVFIVLAFERSCKLVFDHFE